MGGDTRHRAVARGDRALDLRPRFEQRRGSRRPSERPGVRRHRGRCPRPGGVRCGRHARRARRAHGPSCPRDAKRRAPLGARRSADRRGPEGASVDRREGVGRGQRGRVRTARRLGASLRSSVAAPVRLERSRRGGGRARRVRDARVRAALAAAGAGAPARAASDVYSCARSVPPLGTTQGPARPAVVRRREALALDAGAFLDARVLAASSHVDLGGGGALMVSAPMVLRPSLWISARCRLCPMPAARVSTCRRASPPSEPSRRSSYALPVPAA